MEVAPVSLLVPERLDRVEPRGADGRIEAGRETDGGAGSGGESQRPEGDDGFYFSNEAGGSRRRTAVRTVRAMLTASSASSRFRGSPSPG
jgi:hypothetical protein